MIEFNCGKCNHKIEAPDKYAGKLAACPKCKNPVRIPESIGETSTEKPNLIIFRCPNCNQKIRVNADYSSKQIKCGRCKHPIKVPQKSNIEPIDKTKIIKFICPNCQSNIRVPEVYAGKRILCAKCNKPTCVPQASSQPTSPAVEDPTKVLRAGHKQRPAEEGFLGDLGGEDELRLAPPVEIVMEQSKVDYESDGSPLSGSRPPVKRGGNKKKRLAIFIGAACVIVLLLAGVIVWSFVSSFRSSDNEAEVRFTNVQKFAVDYIELLNDGKIKKAKKLLSPELQADTEKANFEKLTSQIGQIAIEQLKCTQKHFEEHPEGTQFYFWFNSRLENDWQSVIVSVLQNDEKLTIVGIATQDSSGDTVSIGQNSFEELSAIILTATFKEIVPRFAKFLSVLVPVLLLLGLLQIVSTWIVFNKAGQPGWAAIVPFYNMWVLAEVSNKPGWLGLLSCFCGAIPFVGPIVQLVLWAVISVGVAKTFGRGVCFGIGLILLPFVFYPILAFVGD
jgi:hypothetical protein